MPSLRSGRLIAALEASFRKACERSDFRLIHYSVQSDHVHFVVEADDAAAIGRGMMALGSRLARAVNRVFGRSGRVLANHYHLHVLRAPREVRNAIAYVLNNGRKHAAAAGRALASMRGRIDPASSGRWFAGWREPQRPARDAPAVALPRTWLLRAGWLRHGAISVDEVPGLSLG